MKIDDTEVPEAVIGCWKVLLDKAADADLSTLCKQQKDLWSGFRPGKAPAREVRHRAKVNLGHCRVCQTISENSSFALSCLSPCYGLSEAAQWVSREEWHPSQKTRWLDDGRFEMKVPFVNETELVMDVLRHGGQVAVKSPESLIGAVDQQLRAALAANATHDLPDGNGLQATTRPRVRTDGPGDRR